MLSKLEPQRRGAVIPVRAAPFIEAARSDNTRRVYRSAWEAFCAFCATTGTPSRPADAALVAEYLTTLAESGRKVPTINMAVSAIAAAHRSSGLDDPTKDESIRLLLAGIRRKLGEPPAQKSPVMREDLAHMLAALHMTNAGRRDRAILLLGFACALRRSELVALNVVDLRFTANGIEVMLRRSKTDQKAQGTVKHVPLITDKTLCPVTAVRGWLENSGITSGPLFRRVDRWDRIHSGRLNDRAVALVVKRAAAAVGMKPDDFAGHSLRAGFATQAAADEVSTLGIREVTGHRSDRMLATYVRRGGAQAREAVRRALGEP